MHATYAVTVLIEGRNPTGWEFSRDLPTFYLDERTQGIVNETHARQIVEKMIEDILDVWCAVFGTCREGEFTPHITVVKL